MHDTLPDRTGGAVQSGELSEWTSQLRRGVLELCILHLLQGGPSYGYES